jgi:hypothetical protein
MKTDSLRLLALLVPLCLPLAACKKDQPPPAADAPHAGSETTSAPAPADAAPALAGANGAPAAAAPATPFDFDSVPEAGGTIPPFPYVDYPDNLHEAFRSTQELPMDRAYVILGNQLHALEGRVSTRTFSHDNAQMSELEVRRNYENAMREMGAVKVNTVGPDDQGVIAAAGGDDYVLRNKMLRIPDRRMSYDVYLARKGPARHWIILMTDASATSMLAVEEKPFVQTIGYVGEGGATSPVTASGAPAAALQPVDIEAVPITAAALPPFPYLAYPPGLHAGFQNTRMQNFDAVHIIVGKALHVVEGKVEQRSFSNGNANMSAMAVRRNYEAAVKGLGGVKVNATGAYDEALLAANTSKDLSEYKLRKERMRVPDLNLSYDSYLVRTPETNIWLILMFGDRDTHLLAVEEKAMHQRVSLVTADTMRKELADKGKIALYINFDTDQATIRPDGKPTVEEIARLLKNDGGLKLAIEGHTDDSGNAARNQALSRERAEVVVQQLVKDGIDAARLRAAGHGASRPLADNKDEAGRAKNRRVELVRG